MSVTVDRIIRSKRRTIALIVEDNGSLTVRAPMRMSAVLIQEFVAKHANWVEKKRAETRAMTPAQPKQYQPGEKFSPARTDSFFPLKPLTCVPWM